MFYNFNFLKKLNPEPNDNHEETIEKTMRNTLFQNNFLWDYLLK